MTLNDLHTFANGDPKGPFPKMMLTVEGARHLLREIEAERDAFDLTAHLKPRQTIEMVHSTCEKLRGHPERSVL